MRSLKLQEGQSSLIENAQDTVSNIKIFLIKNPGHLEVPLPTSSPWDAKLLFERALPGDSSARPPTPAAPPPGRLDYFSTVTPFQKAMWPLMLAAADLGSG